MIARLSRGLGAVAIAGALTFAVPVTSAEAAGGLLGPVGEAIIITMGAVGGGAGVAAAAPELAAAAVPVCATGVGCAVLAVGAAAAVGLYFTRDTWMPLLSNGYDDLTGANDGWSVGAGYRVKILERAAAPQAWGFIWTTERYDGMTGYGLYIPVNMSGDVSCTHSNGVTDTRHYDHLRVVGIPDASGGVSGMYSAAEVKPLDQQLPVTGVAEGGCGYAGDTAVGFRGNADGAALNSYTWGTFVEPTTKSAHMTVNCVNPDGSAYQVTGPETITGPGVPIPEGGNGVVMPTCNDGSVGHQVGAVGQCYTLAATTNGGPLVDQSSNCGAAAAAAAAYPNCVGNNFCTYVVHVNGLPCSVGGIGCVDWPARAELLPQNYQCFFGPYQVGMDKCALLERAYEVLPTGTTIPASGANTDGDPRTHTGPTPSTPPPTTARVPATTTTTTVEPVPCPVGAACTPPPPAPLGDDCFPSGWGAFNPVSWVQQPMQCALKWAFVPTAINTGVITAQLDRAGVTPSITALSTAVGSLGGSAGGCAGPSINFDIGPVHQVVTPFAACTEPMSTVAGFAYAFVSIVVPIGGASKIIALIANGFGYTGQPPTWQQGTLF